MDDKTKGNESKDMTLRIDPDVLATAFVRVSSLLVGHADAGRIKVDQDIVDSLATRYGTGSNHAANLGVTTLLNNEPLPHQEFLKQAVLNDDAGAKKYFAKDVKDKIIFEGKVNALTPERQKIAMTKTKDSDEWKVSA